MSRNWKRTLAAATALLMSLCLAFGSGMTASQVNAAKDTYEDAGYYEMSYIVVADEEMDAEMLASYGLKAGLVLDEDGTGFLFLADDITELTWADGWIESEGETVEYAMRRGTLIMEEEDDGEHVRMEFVLSDDPAPTREELAGSGFGAGGGFDIDDYDTEDVIVVSNVEELMEAIDDYRTVILKPGTYNITEFLNDYDLEEWDWEEYEEIQEDEEAEELDYGLYFEKVFDGEGLVINNVDGLTLISADPKKPAEIVCEPRYAEVLNCVDCDNLTIEHVILGHTDGEGSCTGDVIALHDCWNTQIVGSELYGCGAYAFELDDCYSIDVKDCYIHDCTYGIATIDETYDVSFNHTRFEDCKEFTMFEVSDSGVVFLGCNFKNLDGALISADNDSTVKFAACTFDKDAKASLDEVAGDNIKVIE